jgi:hypothetical protein
MSGNDEEGGRFLERWSRRKAEARDPGRTARPPAQAPAPAPGDAAPPAPPAAAPAGAPPGEIPADEVVDEIPKSLPRIEDLTAESSVAAFLRKGVPLELQRRALRAAWSLDPAIRDFVEVAENQWNWNVPGGVPGSGELAAGTDLGELLAQATGRITVPAAEPGAAVAAGPPAPAAPAVEVVAPPPPAPVRRTAADHGSTAHTDAEIRAAGTGAGSVQTAKTATTEDPAAPVADRSRRRHGGALPS